MTELAIGTSVGTLTAFSALTTPVKIPAAVNFYASTTRVLLGDNSERGIGPMRCTMTWKMILRTQRDQLRTFCTGTTATVYVTLPTNDGNLTYANYQALMVWPLQENYHYIFVTDFVIELRNLIAQ